jgi:hypothetical protein
MRLSDVRRLRAARLVSQRLLHSDANSPVQVATSMLAVQAQDFAAGKWALGVRSPASTVADVDAAFDSGALVRSWPFRGTLHIVAAEDLGWMLALTSARTIRGATTRHRRLGLTDDVFRRAAEVADASLRGGVRLTRDELFHQLETAGVDTAQQRGGNLLWYLSHIGLVCLGPLSKAAQTVVLSREWIRQPRELSRHESLVELALRYFEGHGPATKNDLLAWSKILVPEATEAIDGARDRLTEIVIDGTSYYMPSARSAEDASAVPHPRSHLVLATKHSSRVVPGSNGLFLPLVVSNGQVVGTWRRSVRRGSVDTELAPFDPMPPTNMARYGRASAAYARYLGFAAGQTTVANDEAAVR